MSCPCSPVSSLELTGQRYTSLASLIAGATLGTLLGHGTLNWFCKSSALCLYGWTVYSTISISVSAEGELEVQSDKALFCFEVGAIVAWACVWAPKTGLVRWLMKGVGGGSLRP